MTDYNLVTLFHTSLEFLNQTIMDYISVLFAFLVAGYFIADKLKPSMIMIIVILFTAIAGSQFSNIYFLQHDMQAITTQMALRAANSDFALPDLVMVRGAGSYYPTQDLAIIGAYIGALTFFFHQRRVGLAKP